ncbi:MAG: FHA domain-containing protein [Roseburia sp.]|nr:FHA domain-containing protein [Roseburia sp.]
MRVDVVQELTGRFVRIMVEKDSGYFGTEMLKYNEVEGIMGAEIHHVDSETRLMYQAGDMMSVSELFERKVFTSQEFLELIRQLTDILNRCAEYFLDGRNLLLRNDYMFYDEEKKKLKVIYLDGFDSDVADGISKLLEGFMDTMNHRDRELVFLVYEMHRLTRDGHFNLKKLSDFVGENTKASGRQQYSGHREDKPPHYIEERKTADQKKEAQEERKKQETYMPDGKQESRQKPVKAPGKTILFLAAGFFLTVVMVKSGLLVKPLTGEWDVKRVVVFALVLATAEGYLIRREKAEQKEEVLEDDLDKTEVLIGAASDSDETVVLEKQGHDAWHLNLVPDDWQREEIKVRSSPFFIGKNPAKADGIIGDGEVSRLHAKIVMEENGVFLIDQDSTNGTFLNEKQLVPWERCRVENGDMIGISSIYYRAELYQ